MFLDLSSLRCTFRSTFKLDLCSCSADCPWNTRMVQLILHMWEVIQVTMYNQDFDPERPILSLADCRIPGNKL